jgi:mannose-6-phosphate isomerase-like protein (cupin superfamily)
MSELVQRLSKIVSETGVAKPDFIAETIEALESAGYKIVEIADKKPWGAYIRLSGSQADTFIGEFFPGLSPVEARLGVETAELSPKILIVAPTHRLSWQLHDRRAERWMFLTPGGYYKSDNDEQGELRHAKPGDVVQFAQGERHRLVGVDGHYTVVAEIWQHTDRNHMSEEDDIVRLADDYKR